MSAAELPVRPSRLRRYLPLLGFGLLYWVLSRLDLSALGAAFGRVTGVAVLEAALLFGGNLLLKALRWQRMLAAQGIALPLPVAVAAFFNSQFYGQVTVGRVGELYKAEALTERGVPLGTALSSSLYDRVLDLAVVTWLAVTLGALLLLNLATAVAAGALCLVLAWVALAVLWAPALARLGPVARLRGWLQTRQGAQGLPGLFAQLVLGLGPLLRPAFLIEALLWTGLAWLGYFGSLFRLAAALGLDVSAVLLTAGAALGALSALLPVTVSGLGAREVIFMQVLAREQVAQADAVALSLLHLALMTGSAILLGLCGMLARERQRRAASDRAS